MFGAKGLWHGMTGQFSKQIAQGAGYASGRALGQSAKTIARTPVGTSVMGAAAGGAYGAVSDDTSIIGGMMMGGMAGGLGGAGVRYGGAALKANSVRSGIAAAGRRALGDIGRIGGANVRSNKAFTGAMRRVREFGAGQARAANVRSQAATSGATIGNSISKAANPLPYGGRGSRSGTTVMPSDRVYGIQQRTGDVAASSVSSRAVAERRATARASSALDARAKIRDRMRPRRPSRPYAKVGEAGWR